jgi:hypothetical protein
MINTRVRQIQDQTHLLVSEYYILHTGILQAFIKQVQHL